jgi:hypothetical protein
MNIAKVETCEIAIGQRLRRLYFKIFKRFRRLELRAVSYAVADRLILESVGKPESETWVLAFPEEDYNRVFGLVFLERRERILI